RASSATRRSAGRRVKSLLAKIAFRKAIGLHIGEGELTLSRVAITPFGTVEVARRREAVPPEQLPGALGKWRAAEGVRAGRSRQAVSASIPAQRVFFSTRPIKTTNVNASPQVLLHEVLQSPNVNIDEMVIDLVQLNPGKRPVASIVASRRKYFSGVLAAFQE